MVWVSSSNNVVTEKKKQKYLKEDRNKLDEFRALSWALDSAHQQVNSVSSTVVTIKPSGRTCLVLVMGLPSKFLSVAFLSVFYDAVIAIRCMQIQCIYLS